MPARKKRNKVREKDRARDFVLLLYPENTDHSLAYLKLTSYQYSSLGILHDKDTYTEDKLDKETGEVIHQAGDLKKDHYHFIVRFPNPRYIKAVAEELNIEAHLIDFLDSSFVQYAEYMLHWGKHSGAGKYTYDTVDFVGTLAGLAKEKLINEPKELQLSKILGYIESYKTIVRYTDVYKWAFANGYSSVCTGRINVVKTFVEDHNQRFYYKNFTTCERGKTE